MSDGTVSFDHAIIVAHAARVQQVASDISVASQAASSTNMGGGAFGVMCAFLVAPATVAASMAGTAITAAQGMVSRSAIEVRGLGDDLKAFEEEATAAIQALEGGLG